MSEKTAGSVIPDSEEEKGSKITKEKIEGGRHLSDKEVRTPLSETLGLIKEGEVLCYVWAPGGDYEEFGVVRPTDEKYFDDVLIRRRNTKFYAVKK